MFYRNWMKLIITVALYTSMRLGEILALKWSNVSLEEGAIMVRWAVTETKAHGLQLKRPKIKGFSVPLTPLHHI